MKMEVVMHVLETISFVIQLAAVAVMLWGVGICVFHFVQSVCVKNERRIIPFRLMKSRIELGVYILLGLELLIVADIIESIVNPTWEEILLLASIVAIRTGISFFMNMEIKDINEEIKIVEEKFD